ncbi:MAG: permease [Thermoguttaceae bacterium]
MKKELGIFAGLTAVFLVAYFLNLADPRIQNAIMEAFSMLQWYARNHTLACVVPAMFIAGAIATFLSKEAVLRHLGPRANKLEAYSVASVSGTVLAVCSCSVLPMFAGIYRIGAGLGPAAAFLYSGPAINVMAIFLTARVLGFELGLARVVGAIGFAFLVGLAMAVIFRREEEKRTAAVMQLPEPPPARRRLWQTAAYFAAMILFLVFSDWADPSRTVVVLNDDAKLTMMDGTVIRANPTNRLEVAVLLETTENYRVQLEAPAGSLKPGTKLTLAKRDILEKKQSTPEGYGWAAQIFNVRWYLAGACLVAVLAMLAGWFGREELAEWMGNTWGFAKSIIPLLFAGVFITGFVGALLPEKQVGALVGGDSLRANLVASVIGALWYFATLTEIPILEALIGLGMGKGPALALLLAGPALSLPSIAVIYSVFGFRKTATFVGLVIVLSTLAGMLFGAVVA